MSGPIVAEFGEPMPLEGAERRQAPKPLTSHQRRLRWRMMSALRGKGKVMMGDLFVSVGAVSGVEDVDSPAAAAAFDVLTRLAQRGDVLVYQALNVEAFAVELVAPKGAAL